MRILLIGHVYYDQDNAARLRCLEVVSALKNLGHEVIVYNGMSFASSCLVESNTPDIDFRLAEPPTNRLQRLLSRIGVGFGLLHGPVVREQFDIIYCYGTELSWMVAGWLMARRLRARMVLDATELYDFQQIFSSFSAFRSRIGSWLGIFPGTALFVSAVAAPSQRYLRLFRCFHRRVVLLPPFFGPIDSSTRHHIDEQSMTLAYAGSPAGKDLLSLILDALAGMPPCDHRPISFNIVGPTVADIAKIIRNSGNERLMARRDITLNVIGRTTAAKARSVVEAADFLLAVRAPSIRINYGFPSKVAEAFCLGVPVICNSYSDIEEYLEDGVNGMLVPECSAGALRATFIRCLGLASTEYEDIRKQARATGERFFSAKAIEGALGFLVDQNRKLLN